MLCAKESLLIGYSDDACRRGNAVWNPPWASSYTWLAADDIATAPDAVDKTTRSSGISKCGDVMVSLHPSGRFTVPDHGSLKQGKASVCRFPHEIVGYRLGLSQLLRCLLANGKRERGKSANAKNAISRLEEPGTWAAP
ncbi:hypothetical protein DPEC_G00319180 [Dallia pectoralis]|uniref:Uncharacterized protein n=1 Tax=Dallia pectoralis TaxID=75939 RepID=A0ACC2F9L1_DALPE|nr:hypothetical protein DPEC_G00319180 [Dallia pectoralis]